MEVLPRLAILVVDDEPNIRKTLTISLEAEGHPVTAVSNARDALSEANRRFFDLALVDLRLGTESGLTLLPALAAACPWVKIVVMTAYASIDTAVEAMRRGAFDYLPKPFTHEQVAALVRKIAEVRALEQKVASLQEVLHQVVPEADLASRNPAMQRTLEMAHKVADSAATILIRGESGTGKTVLGPGHPFLEPPRRQHFRDGFLPVAVTGTSGERAVRAREGRLHRGAARSSGAHRRLRGRHPVS